MKTIIILLLLSLIGTSLYAQPKPQTIEVSAGQNINEVVDKELQFSFENFTDGVALHKDGGISKARFNYSYLLSEMQYIEASTNDTLALGKDSGITVISIGGRKFIPGLKDREYIELLTDGDISLGVRHSSKMLSMGSKGAYGTTNITSSTSSVSSITVGTADYGYGQGEFINMGGYQKLSVSEAMRINLDSYYYLVNPKNNKATLITNSKSYLKTFPKDKTSLIEKYVEENSIDFKNEEDLLKLTNYCNQL